MCEIIDFQAIRCDFLRREADRRARLSSDLAARAEWLRRNGASLADQLRAALDAAKAEGDLVRTEEALAMLRKAIGP